MVALCGEFPADQLTRLIPSPSYGEKLITELKAQKLLRTHYRDHLRGYRLTGRAKQMLLTKNPERFHDFLTGNTETNQVRSEVARRLRLYQKAETYLTLLRAGIPFFTDQKPDIFRENREAGILSMGGAPSLLFLPGVQAHRSGGDQDQKLPEHGCAACAPLCLCTV